MKLLSIISPAEGELFRATLPKGEYTIGRSDESDISIVHPSISDEHACLLVSPNRVLLTDLGSESGTFFEEARLDIPTAIPDGGEARIGELILKISSPLPSARLGDQPSYLPGKTIAEGGMGAILKAEQSAMGRQVAMKVMLDGGDPHTEARFLNEARITGKLEHPNIVPVHELGVDEGQRVFYTMKLVQGLNLAEIIAALRARDPETLRSYPLSEVLTVFQKVCDAVAFAHSHQIIHRDLKPENIMVGAFGEVLVMDWGLAKDITDTSPENFGTDPLLVSLAGTIDGTIMGTPRYMAPEQARGEIGKLDARSDLFSLGAILHELLYLNPIVSGQTAAEIVDKVGSGRFDSGADSGLLLPWKKVPASLQAIASKATALDPGGRYQMVAELQADLRAFQSGFATDAEDASFVKHLALYFRRHRGTTSAIGAGAAILALATIWFTIRLVGERNQARVARTQAEEALALVEPARLRATAALAEAEAARSETADERDRALNALAQIQRMKTRADLALATLSDSDEIYAALSALSLRSGNVGEALKSIDQALAARPAEVRYLVAKANLLQASGRFRAAIPNYRRALELEPDPSVEANLVLSEALAEELENEQELTDAVTEKLKAALEAQNRVALILNQPDDPKAPKPEINSGDPSPAAFAFEQSIMPIPLMEGWSTSRIKELGDGAFGLDLQRLKQPDLGALVGKKIIHINIRDTGVVDLDGLRGLPLKRLYIDRGTTDLSPLRGMPLEFLHMWGSKVNDLSPIENCPLEELEIGASAVESLAPLANMKLKRLSVLCNATKDFAALSTLTELATLAVPDQLSGVDLSRLTKLRHVLHARTNPKGGWYPGQEFIKWMRLSDAQWEKWESALRATGATDLKPERLTVRNTAGIYLDLKGTGVTSLRPLIQMPIFRIDLDTTSSALDLGPLSKIPTLKHVYLDGPGSKGLRPLAEKPELQSLTMRRDVRGAHLFQQARRLTHIGYRKDYDRSTLLPRAKKGDFFRARPLRALPGPLASPFVFFNFDDPIQENGSWNIWMDDGPRSKASEFAYWNADPPDSHDGTGRGGGVLTFLEGRGFPNGGGVAYFNAPEKFLGNKSQILGSLLEFDLRCHYNGNEFGDYPDLVLRSSDTTLVRALPHLPYGRFTNYLIPIQPDGQWKLSRLDGDPADQEDFEEVLANLTALRIRSEFQNGDDHCDLDDLKIWKPQQTRPRLKLNEQRLAKLGELVAWREKATISSGDAMRHAKSQLYHLIRFREPSEAEQAWLHEYNGKKGVLMVHPLDRADPGTVSFALEGPIAEGSAFSFFLSGWNGASGVTAKVRLGDQVLKTFPSEDEWKRHALILPEIPAGKSNLVIEIHPIGWSKELAFLHNVKLHPAKPDPQVRRDIGGKRVDR